MAKIKSCHLQWTCRFCQWSQKSEARDTKDAQVLMWGAFEKCSQKPEAYNLAQGLWSGAI